MESKKGAVPIPYIIAIVLGIIVLAILAYWLFFSSGQAGLTITEYSCRSKKMAYCNAWKMNAWQNKPDDVDFSTRCEDIKTEEDRKKYYAPDCCQFTWAWNLQPDDCK